MKSLGCIALAACLFGTTPAVTQPKLAFLVSGGPHLSTTPVDKLSPAIIVGSWIAANSYVFLSTEYQWFKSSERFPEPPSGFSIGPFVGKNSTQRVAFGLHYRVNTIESPMSLLGLSVGRSWSKSTYGIHALPLEEHEDIRFVTDRADRWVMSASWTLFFGGGNIKFLVQPRYGYSFRRIALDGLREPAAFGQILLGVRLSML